ncbi:MAG: DsbA family protein [Pseudomonadota bacterium]
MISRSLLVLALGWLIACSDAGMPGASAQQTDGMSQEEFDAKLRDAFDRNPELIIEAIEAYRTRLQANAAAASEEMAAELLPTLTQAESGHAIGASTNEADIVIIEFFDYHCGFCKRAMEEVLEVSEENPKIRVVFQELPILRRESHDAAKVAIAASLLKDENAYLSVHKALMQAGGVLDDKRIEKSLKRAGVSATAIADAQEQYADEIEQRLERSTSRAKRLGVGGTPYFIVARPATGELRVVEGFREDTIADLVKEISG